MPSKTTHYKPLTTLDLAPFVGEVASSYDGPEYQAWLKRLPEHLANSTEDQLLFKMRNRVYRLPCPLGRGELCIKAFRTPGALRSTLYRHKGSKAQRAHENAKHLYEQNQRVAEPIGYLERWRGNQLEQSYLISRYLERSSDFYSEMASIIHEQPYAGRFIQLIRRVAEAVRAMHDSGFMHGDLGPQNILMQRLGKADWGNINFIDLNRGKKLGRPPTLKERAKDLDRMKIPNHFRHIFYHIYFGDTEVPAPFMKWAQHYYNAFERHQKSRKWRHPIRTVIRQLTSHQPKTKKVTTGIPPHRDIWLWDEFSGQPSVVLTGRERRQERSMKDTWLTLKACAANAVPIYRAYQNTKETAFTGLRSLEYGLGVSIEVDTEFDAQRAALASLPSQSLLVRCYFHLGEKHWVQCQQAIAQLKSDGHSISLSLIQSRQALLEPSRWDDFITRQLAINHHLLDAVEIGHAINRVKWGCWNLEEIGQLWRAVPALRQQYSGVTFIGPAVNDFEFQYYPPLLHQQSNAFDALSGHLYVDRRGAPENEQNGFSTVEKTLLAKAMAQHFGKPRYYITEVNWPIKDTGLYSPLAGAYLVKGKPESPLHVSEAQSAAYMIRYALLALCSGATERIWWWRLAHPGFGLLDSGDAMRPRPGWHAYCQFQKMTTTGRFLNREFANGIYQYHFEGFTLAYSTEAKAVLPIKYGVKRIENMLGEAIPSAREVQLSGEPLYLIAQ